MNICIPVEVDNGLESSVCAHFGSAPAFMLVDTDSGGCRALANANQHHGHGKCMPLQSLQGEQIDAVLVCGIGEGALHKLKAASIEVYLAQHATVAEAVNAFKAGSLQLVQPGMACTHRRREHS